jgi:hypothetical protein
MGHSSSLFPANFTSHSPHPLMTSATGLIGQREALSQERSRSTRFHSGFSTKIFVAFLLTFWHIHCFINFSVINIYFSG